MSKKKSNGYGDGTYLKTKMYLSAAFLSLGQKGSCKCISTVSCQVLIMLLGKRKFSYIPRKGGSNKKWVRSDNNEFTLTYKELLSYGKNRGKPLIRNGKKVRGMMTQPQITRAFDELLAKGFIKIAEYGGAFDRHKSKYSLVNDWVNWKWGDRPIRVRRRENKRGFQDKKKQNTAYVNVAHPRIRERCTPTGETHTLAMHTPIKGETNGNHSRATV